MLVSLFQTEFLCFFLVSDGIFLSGFLFFFLLWASCIPQCDSPATNPQVCSEQDLAEGHSSELWSFNRAETVPGSGKGRKRLRAAGGEEGALLVMPPRWFCCTIPRLNFGLHAEKNCQLLAVTVAEYWNKSRGWGVEVTWNFVALGFFIPTLNYHNFSSLLIFPYHINKSCAAQLVPSACGTKPFCSCLILAVGTSSEA